MFSYKDFSCIFKTCNFTGENWYLIVYFWGFLQDFFKYRTYKKNGGNYFLFIFIYCNFTGGKSFFLIFLQCIFGLYEWCLMQHYFHVCLEYFLHYDSSDHSTNKNMFWLFMKTIWRGFIEVDGVLLILIVLWFQSVSSCLFSLFIQTGWQVYNIVLLNDSCLSSSHVSLFAISEHASAGEHEWHSVWFLSEYVIILMSLSIIAFACPVQICLGVK